jgi:hypothetical protein
METTAKKIEPEIITEEIAEIVRVDEDRILVATELRRFDARRAFGCLVDPMAGDLVLVAAGEERAFVVTVLERRNKDAARVTVPGDLAIESLHGGVRIAGRTDVTITSRNDVTMASRAMSLVSAEETRIVSGALAILATVADVDVDRVRAVAQTVETFAQRCVRRVKRAFSFVEETEQVHAERIELKARSVAHVNGKNVAMTAEDLVKIDGGQIHLG